MKRLLYLLMAVFAFGWAAQAQNATLYGKTQPVTISDGTHTPAIAATEALTSDNAIAVRLAQSIPSGTHSIGYVYLRPSATAGCDPFRRVSTASTNACSIKALQGQVFGVYAINTTASTKYVHLYDNNGTPTVGTDAILLTIAVPANTLAQMPFQIPACGISFSTGIALSITGGSAADNDTTAVSAGDVIVHVWYH